MSQAKSLNYDEIARRGGDAAMRQLGRFFMGDDPVHRTLERIARKLAQIGVPYAVVGGMALNAHGYQRATTDVDVLVTAEGLKRVHEMLEGLGYVRPFAGSKHLRDTETTVRIEFLVTGQFPGDGREKPISFPDPTAVSTVIDGISYLGLPTLLELKLASGMTNAGRLKDLADVQEMIRALPLPRDYGQKLHPFVRPKFEELWDAVASTPDGHEEP